MNPDLTQINNRLTMLENLLKSRSTNFDEKIRNTVTYDIDNVTVTTHVVTAIDTHGDTVSITVPKNPDTYLRVKFRGTTYNIPAYKLS